MTLEPTPYDVLNTGDLRVVKQPNQILIDVVSADGLTRKGITIPPDADVHSAVGILNGYCGYQAIDADVVMEALDG